MRVGERFTVEVDEEIEAAINARSTHFKAATTKDGAMDVEDEGDIWLADKTSSSFSRRSKDDTTIHLDRIRGVRRDPLVEAYFAEMIAITPWSDTSKHISDCKTGDYEAWRNNLDDSSRELSTAFDNLFGVPSDCLVHFTLSDHFYPLSGGMLESIALTGYASSGEDIVNNNNAISARLQDEARRRDMLQGRLQRFVELAQARLRGSKVSVMTLWIHLDSLIVVLQADVSKSRPPTNDISQHREEPVSAWSLFPDLTGRFLSPVSLSSSLTAGAEVSASSRALCRSWAT